METEVSYIQANPGFHIAKHTSDYGNLELKLEAYLTPIIAWKIQRVQDRGRLGRELVIPVSIDGPDDENPIVYPDGRVIRVKRSHLSTFDSIEKWLEHETKRKNELRERMHNKGEVS